MLPLLAQRAAVLLLRPAALLTEGALAPGANVLIFVLPAAALALTASSVPVHTRYMQTLGTGQGGPEVEREYVSGLTIVTVIAAGILAVAAALARGTAIDPIVIAVVATFLVEKYSDELSRLSEFRKRYNRWFLVQTLRSLWLFVPFVLAGLGAPYAATFATVACLAAVLAAVHYVLHTGLQPSVTASGLRAIRANAVFLASAGILAIHRQLPRLAVATLFPGIAHVYQAASQLGQGISLLFGVRYQVPYRKVIARRPQRFEQHMGPTFTRFVVAGAVTVILMAICWHLTPDGLAGVLQPAMLLTALGAEALALSVMSAYLGYLPWFVSEKRALGTYAIAALALAACGGAGYGAVILKGGDVILLPLMTVTVSISWVLIIRVRHFRVVKAS